MAWRCHLLYLCTLFGLTEGAHIFNISEFAAIPDGRTSNTVAFVRAISAIREAGGGTLLIPRGRWLTGPFNLTSHIVLFLDEEATLLGSTELHEWPLMPAMPSYGQGRDHPGPRRVSLIHGFHLINVTIRGNSGTIDGQGPFWWKRHAHGEVYTRGHLVELINCSDILIEDIVLRDSPFWTVHPVYSRQIVVRRLTIINDFYRNGACHDWNCSGCNTDGFDPDSSSDIFLEDSHFQVGDDGIAIKSGWDCFGWQHGSPSQNITIRNLTVESPRAAGIAIGSEMSGGVSDVHVMDSTFINCSTGIRLKASRTRSGYIKNLSFDNIRSSGILKAVIEIAGGGGRNPSCSSVGPIAPPPTIDNIQIFNLKADDNKGLVMDLEGLQDAPSTNLDFANITVTGSGLDYKCTGGTVGRVERVMPPPPATCGLNGKHFVVI